MKVKELIEELAKVDGERIVIMSRDGEGNGFSPLSGIDDEQVYKADTTWSGETGFEKLTPGMIKEGYSEEDLLEGGEPALILWPTN